MPVNAVYVGKLLDFKAMIPKIAIWETQIRPPCNRVELKSIIIALK